MDGAHSSGKDKRFFLVEHRLNVGLKDEIAIIKVAAVGALISTLREMVKQAVPTLAPHMERARSQRDGQPLERPPQQPAPMSRAGVNGGAI
jgi:hypothetical protein